MSGCIRSSSKLSTLITKSSGGISSASGRRLIKFKVHVLHRLFVSVAQRASVTGLVPNANREKMEAAFWQTVPRSVFYPIIPGIDGVFDRIIHY